MLAVIEPGVVTESPILVLFLNAHLSSEGRCIAYPAVVMLIVRGYRLNGPLEGTFIFLSNMENYTNIYEINIMTNILWVLNFGQVGVQMKIY